MSRLIWNMILMLTLIQASSAAFADQLKPAVARPSSRLDQGLPKEALAPASRPVCRSSVQSANRTICRSFTVLRTGGGQIITSGEKSCSNVCYRSA